MTLMSTFRVCGFVVAAAVALMLSSAAATEPLPKTEAPVKMITEMLYPTVMIDTGRGGVGSGTVIFSDRRSHQSKDIWSLVITNFHVVKNAVSIHKEFDPKQGKEIQKETRRPVHVRLWDYNDFSTAVGTTGRIGRIVAWDQGRDLALLRLDDQERVIEHVAVLWDTKDGGPYLFQTTWAIGSGLGNPPYPTQGLLSGIAGKDQQGKSLYLSSAPIIFGNSGGSLWAFSTRRDTFEMIGIPSMISGYGWGKIVPHMAWSRPISEIREFLSDNDFGFVFGEGT